LSKTFPLPSEDLPAILASAKAAQEKWRETAIVDRCALLDRLRQIMLAARNDLAQSSFANRASLMSKLYSQMSSFRWTRRLLRKKSSETSPTERSRTTALPQN